MPAISFRQRGDLRRTTKYLSKLQDKHLIIPILEKHAVNAISALEQATPERTGLTKQSWEYKITSDRRGYRISFMNTNTAGSTPVIILIQYGHGTGTGGYVQGQDIINPAIRPIFNALSEEIWKEVTSL